MMELGGNKRLRNFLNNYSIENEPIKLKYQSEAAYYYRAHLENMIEGNPVDPPPSVEEGKVIREEKRNIQENYGGFGSAGNEPVEEDFEDKAKKVFSSIGSFFKKAYNTTATKTKEVS